MPKNIFKIVIAGFLILFPLSLQGQNQKTFVEDFSSRSKIEEKATFAFINLRQKEVTLPLHYTLKDLSKVLKGFDKTYVSALGTDGLNLMVGGANGALNLIGQDETGEDLTGLLGDKAKQINAIDFAKEGGWWLVGGEAKNKKEGALLFKLVPGGLKTEDLQEQTKAIKMEVITDISCLDNRCLIAGRPKKLALFDGQNLIDLSTTSNLILNDPIRITNNKIIWFIVTFHRAQNLPGQPYLLDIYSFDGNRFQTISLTETAQSSSQPSGEVGWNGHQWLIAKGKPSLTVWQLDGTTVQEITNDFLALNEKFSFDPVIVSDGQTWFIGGRNQWKGLLAKNNFLITNLSLIIPELRNINLFSATKGPWSGVVLGGSFFDSPLLLNLELGDYLVSSAIESKIIASSGNQVFKTAKIEIEADLPPSTGIDFMLAPKENSWEPFTPGVEKEFLNKGNSLRWRAVLTTSDSKTTPRLKKLTITYTTETPETPTLIKSRDERRINDLRQVAEAIKNFKKKRGGYPIVEAPDPVNRWKQLESLLVDGKFISQMPNDPLKEKDLTRQYDYLTKSDGSQYLLLARLEDSTNKFLEKDLDGTPLQISYSTYSCDDPIYCQGDVSLSAPTSLSSSSQSTPSSQPTLPPDKVEIQLLRDPQKRVWQIVNNKRLYIPSPQLFEKLGFRWSQVKDVSFRFLQKYPPARLLKTKNNPDVYYLRKNGLKHRIPSWQAFLDYGNKISDIIEVEPEVLQAFGESNLITLPNDKRVWKIEGTTRRYIPNPDVFKAHHFKWEDIMIVNWAEYNSYTEGPPLD